MDQRSRDQKLASFTDALLDGLDWAGDEPPLAEAAKKLAGSLDNQPVPEHLRRQVMRQVNTEWPKPVSPWSQRLGRLFRRPTQRLVWGMMTIMIVLMTLVVVDILPSETGSILGTATGETDTIVFILSFLAILACLGLVWNIIRKRKP